MVHAGRNHHAGAHPSRWPGRRRHGQWTSSARMQERRTDEPGQQPRPGRGRHRGGWAATSDVAVGVQEARPRRFRVHLGRCLHLVWWRRLARLRDVGSLVHRTRVRRGVLVVRRVCPALRGSVRWLHGVVWLHRVVRRRGDVRRGALRTSVDVVGVIGTMRGIVVGSWGATSGTRLACLGALRMGVRPGRPTPCIGGSPAGSTC